MLAKVLDVVQVVAVHVDINRSLAAVLESLGKGIKFNLELGDLSV